MRFLRLPAPLPTLASALILHGLSHIHIFRWFRAVPPFRKYNKRRASCNPKQKRSDEPLVLPVCGAGRFDKSDQFAGNRDKAVFVALQGLTFGLTRFHTFSFYLCGQINRKTG